VKSVHLEPCLLLLIKERPSHGYDLVARIKSLGIDQPSPVIYRALRSLEEKHAIQSGWEFSNIGPARRVYKLTTQGDAVLKAWVAVLEETARSINHYLDRYSHTMLGACVR
jgi:DNA-binding PadR family transcriptional regulator